MVEKRQKLTYLASADVVCGGNGLFGLGSVTDRLHIGNRWMAQSGFNTYDNTARMHYPLLPSFDVPDPLSQDYPSLSPYSHCAGNPLSLIDPTGKDIWRLNADGEIVSVQSDKSKDMIVIDKGDAAKAQNITFEYGTIEKQESHAASFDMYKIRGDENGTAAFEFLANNTSVEWGHTKVGKDGEMLNFITTSHSLDTEEGMSILFSEQFKSGYTLREFNHSHPQNSAYPSGLKNRKDDIGFALDVIALSGQSPKFNIYVPLEKCYIPYNEKSQYSDFIFNGATLPELIVPYKKQ